MTLDHKKLIRPVLLALVLFLPSVAGAAETDVLVDVLKKIDVEVCSVPSAIKSFYSVRNVILFDDKRILLENRIKDYEAMRSDLINLKCKTDRKVLAGALGKGVSYLLVDETSSVTSESGHIDERQHNVCTYAFLQQGGTWKISHEHCSSLPDYTIVPGDDALYYFHNPVY